MKYPKEASFITNDFSEFEDINALDVRNIRVTMAYRGTNYHGFQRQNNAITIQEIIEKCLGKILCEEITIYGCSRTDTGVHAKAYCFNFLTKRKIPLEGLRRGMNNSLPKDISIASCKDVSLSFHSRYDSIGKEYIYKINTSKNKDPFTQDLALHYPKKINSLLLHDASQEFLGTQDFQSFSNSGTNKINTIRTVYEFNVSAPDENTVIMSVMGDGFLYNMVRIMVGTLLFINEGKIKPCDLKNILSKKNRMLAGKTVSAHGLYLNRVMYNSDGLYPNTSSADLLK